MSTSVCLTKRPPSCMHWFVLIGGKVRIWNSKFRRVLRQTLQDTTTIWLLAFPCAMYMLWFNPISPIECPPLILTTAIVHPAVHPQVQLSVCALVPRMHSDVLISKPKSSSIFFDTSCISLLQSIQIIGFRILQSHWIEIPQNLQLQMDSNIVMEESWWEMGDWGKVERFEVARMRKFFDVAISILLVIGMCKWYLATIIQPLYVLSEHLSSALRFMLSCMWAWQMQQQLCPLLSLLPKTNGWIAHKGPTSMSCCYHRGFLLHAGGISWCTFSHPSYTPWAKFKCMGGYILVSAKQVCEGRMMGWICSWLHQCSIFLLPLWYIG